MVSSHAGKNERQHNGEKPAPAPMPRGCCRGVGVIMAVVVAMIVVPMAAVVVVAVIAVVVPV